MSQELKQRFVLSRNLCAVAASLDHRQFANVHHYAFQAVKRLFVSFRALQHVVECLVWPHLVDVYNRSFQTLKRLFVHFSNLVALPGVCNVAACRYRVVDSRVT